MKLALLLLALLGFLSQSATADYYLKFSTAGGSHSKTQKLADNTNASITVSIVDSHPVDGLVHYEGTDTGTYSSYVQVSIEKTLNVDYLNFYYADVPRSVTLVNTAFGTKQTVTFGGSAVTLSGAPSIMLPDQLLVFPAIAQNWNTDSFSIVMGAVTKLRQKHSQSNSHIDDFGVMPSVPSTSAWCNEGWHQSTVNPKKVEAWQRIRWPDPSRCYPYQMYGGELSHIVKFK